MTETSEILCLGALAWDTIGRCAVPVPPGADVPGRVRRHPGGVAFNIARGLARAGHRAALVSAVGDDEGGIAAKGWAVILTGPENGVGSGTSSYVHPAGYRCGWSYLVTLRRPFEGDLD